MQVDETEPDDPVLVAFLDGALDDFERRGLEARLAAEPALRVRLELLRAGSRPFAEAYSGVLGSAPVAAMQARLDAALGSRVSPEAPETAASGRTDAARRWGTMAVAAGLALFAAGYVAGHGLPAGLPFGGAPEQAEESPDHWRQVVADYLTLTTSQTLTALKPPDEQLKAELGTALAKVGLKADRTLFDLPGRRLMKVELYHYDGSPLVQITYLDEENGPISLCLTRQADRATTVETERRGTMNVAYWSSASHAFMLVGLAPEQTLTEIAARLAPELDGAS
jgi:hypothetical protein